MKITAVATAAGVAYALGWLSRQHEVVAARREASTDGLTGLVNRFGLKRQLRIRADRGQPYTVYLIDLNGFKPINDTFGHRAGDELLRQLGRRLRMRLCEHLVARLGGDEFVVIADGPAPIPGLPGRIQAAVQVPTTVAGSPEPVTLRAAIGFVHAAAGSDPRVALHTADLAMYRSKTVGFPSRAAGLIDRQPDEAPRIRVRDARHVRVA
jgi:diguanylate cyclase (GGDEF)-like protein